jgi:hypothetical protein
MKRRTRIYVAGPLNALACDYLKNVHQMMQCAEALRKKGYSVYVPALDLLMGLTFGNYEYGDYFENSQPWLDASDAMFLCLGWEKSVGTLRELDRAAQRCIPHYCDIDKLAADVPAEMDDDE